MNLINNYISVFMLLFIINKGINYFKLFFYSFQFVQHYKTMCRHKLKEDDPKYLPVNKYKHISYFIKPNTCPIQTPNFDTLYSNSILDISQGYVKLKIPKYILNNYNNQKKYYSIQFIDISGNNVGFISLRNNINEYDEYYIINKNNIEDSIKHIGKDPINKFVLDSWFIYIILRIQVDFTDEIDLKNSIIYQNNFNIEFEYVSSLQVYLSSYLKFDMNQNIHVSKLNDVEFYKIFKHCYKYYINFNFNKFYYDFNEYSYYLKLITFFCKKFTNFMINRDYKGWVSRKSFDKFRMITNENILKTMISWKYLYAIDQNEAIYYMNRYDYKGKKLNGDSIYVLNCENEFNYSNCFWSISSYDYNTGQFIENLNEIYSKGNNLDNKVTIILTSKKLNEDYMKYIKYKVPNKESIDDYVLYTPKNEYYLILRIYYPKDDINNYILPKIEKIN